MVLIEVTFGESGKPNFIWSQELLGQLLFQVEIISGLSLIFIILHFMGNIWVTICDFVAILFSYNSCSTHQQFTSWHIIFEFVVTDPPMILVLLLLEKVDDVEKSHV